MRFGLDKDIDKPVTSDERLVTSNEQPATSNQHRASSTERIFIGLGSNLGDRAGWLRKALQKSITSPMIELVHASAIYETDPVGKIDQPMFLNQVVELRSTLAPEELLDWLLYIEAGLGRERRERWGPRIIDLDLLAYGNRQAHTNRLVLPHAELHRRRFVLAPWAEIAPEFEVAGFKATVNQLLQRCDDRSRVQKLKT
ncbi:MAG: 2-amino-4-hydroxy-6-hydroxymethyldihydropteridine diphosphokinase [candidate division KSB1 bacterium]|nr:2-amino-4-hydroxy-6-hydroxymethyldihydropteridine diphosphokinase [candidate division KSB1 bacterium]MDZ7365063.1 2-amino-4-hydroxy-6-hydroxymethyldihydropteridine diphosphokinase [candidate division KSB1 bacterium]MDZ7403457.1 2-amino-4-hydroxy-6-hydroxymethyldihydropteridine diphosphokinase [candidate division KSB1 bacterium]